MMKKPKQSEQHLMANTVVLRSGADGNPRKRFLIGTPTLGIVRMEWAVARYGQTIPPNWTSADVNVGIGCLIPMHYLVADAQNLLVDHAITNNFEWLLLWEDDVIATVDLYTRIDEYIEKATIPIVSGLYFIKSDRSEPVMYRGRGTRYFGDFQIGDKVWVDGVPTGMLLIHHSILEIMHRESKPYQTLGGRTVPKVFDTPGRTMWDTETQNWNRMQGTSDLEWCHRVQKDKVLERAGWKSIAKKQNPFLVDTNILCQHIDLSTGRQYPNENILNYFRTPLHKRKKAVCFVQSTRADR